MTALVLRRSAALAAGLLAVASVAGPQARAASHREAPLMTLDPGADISDVYAFVSYDAANLRRAPGDRKATLVMNVVPSQEPSSGPNYFAFDDDVLYAIKVDRDRDGVDDVEYQFQFSTRVDSPGQFIATAGVPPVTDLDGPNAAGLSRKQTYRVFEVRDCAGRSGCVRRRELFAGRTLFAVPSNIGPATMPDYDALAAKGIYEDPETGIRVFAGQRAETFAIDLGAVFDTLNLRTESPPARPLPTLSAAEDADDDRNSFGVNHFSGFNVNTIALELPIRRLTADGAAPNDANRWIGVYAATSRRALELRQGEPVLAKGTKADDLRVDAGGWRQVSRMGNPLVNELVIPIGKKDLWNASAPEDEAQFVEHYRNLSVAAALELVSGVPVTPNPREDIVSLLLLYPGQQLGQKGVRLSELLRLDLSVPPTPPDKIRRLGPFSQDANGNPTPDPAGFPNGRRPNDDVTDLVVRVAGGPLYVQNRVGDGVNNAEKGITPSFPFLPTPFDGRNRRHLDTVGER
ncbi:MAG TPA: DUF4331 domain-containing protein [Myxococcota bacterium]|nr:DUF4331 domain-containing protein [Myxococcota bacterium]